MKLALLFLGAAVLFGQKLDPGLVQVEDVPGLPRVLLIGDSISMGYTPLVREKLQGRANVHHPPENCGDTARGLVKLDQWLGSRKWDVIHFNFGLHDLKYLDEAGRYVTPDKGRQVATTQEYEANLRRLAARLEETGARLIWASTTPVPEGSQGRVQGDERVYNEVAAKVMRESGIEIDDLHAVVTGGPAEVQLPHNVHFTKEGYAALAEAVVVSVAKGPKL